jgi:hypothetical protein
MVSSNCKVFPQIVLDAGHEGARDAVDFGFQAPAAAKAFHRNATRRASRCGPSHNEFASSRGCISCYMGQEVLLLEGDFELSNAVSDVVDEGGSVQIVE